MSGKPANREIFLHQLKLSLLLPLLGVELVDLGLEPPFMLAESLVIHSLLFKLT